MNGLYRRIREERGAAIVLVALTMVAMLSAVALAVDVGMLVTARTEAQRVGDAAALAGAGILRDSNGDSAQAHNKAVEFASTRNTVQGSYMTIANSDVQVIPEEWTVRVQVRNAQPTFFARIFGVRAVNIATNSAAWAVESATIGSETDESCPALPLSLVDKYIESNEEDGWQDGEDIVGWGTEDHGTLLRLYQKKNAPDERPEVQNFIDYCLESTSGSSYRCYWNHPGENPSTGYIEEKIAGEHCTPVSIGNNVENAAGANQSVIAAWRQLILDDPFDLQWSEDKGCVVAAADPGACFTDSGSKRLRSVPILDQTTLDDPDDTGSNIDGEVKGFVGIFVENVSSSWDGPLVAEGLGKAHVYLRIVQQGGSGSANNDGENDPEATVRTLQLIE